MNSRPLMSGSVVRITRASGRVDRILRIASSAPFAPQKP